MADRNEENFHGEDEVKPRFGSDDYKPGGKDSSKDVYDKSGNERTGTSAENKKALDRREINEQENTAASGARSAVDQKEGSFLKKKAGENKGGFFRKEGNGTSRLKVVRGKFTRQRIATIAIGAILSGSGFYGVAILSGPFQFIHYASKLQKAFKSNEDFGDDRASKVLLYALAGQGAQKGRLGITGNYSANKWEKRLEAETGMRPVYQEGTRRFVGFEIVNDSKAKEVLGDIGEKDNRSGRRIQQSMGKGARISTVGNTGLYNSTSETRIDGNRRFVDLREVNFGDRRTWIRTITKSTRTNRVASSMASRLLIKRAGVNFHPLNKAKGKIDAKVAKLIEDRRAKSIQDGVETSSGDLKAESQKNDKGEDVGPSASDVEASSETKSYIDDFKNSGAFKSAKGAAVVTGVLCVAKGFGNKVEDYKYANSALPMMRMGFFDLATGQQGMSNNDIDLGTMGVLSKSLYDKEKNQSWTEAETIRAEDGKTGGVPPPREADLGKLGEKPKLFRIIDDVPGLSTVCTIQDTFGNLPIIKNIGNAANGIVEGIASSVGIDVDSLIESALKAVAGKSVDPAAKAADRANLGMIGNFLNANDQSLAMGGKALSNDEREQLNALEDHYEELDRQSKTMVARYFDPTDSKSVVGSIIDSSPSSPAHAAAMVANPIKTVGSGISGLFSSFIPKTKASGLYDYGVPKFGFSAAEQARAGYDYEYENPYENAYKVVEPNLPYLNDRYGKCFGITVTTDDKGVHIHSDDKSVNIFKTYNPDSKDYKPDCDANTNTDNQFNHYRFYIADAVTAVSLACYEGDETACAEVGMGDVSSSDGGEDADGDTTGGVSGSASELAQKLLDMSKSGKISIQDYSEDMEADRATRSLASQQLQDIADGNKASLSTRCDYSLPKSVAPDPKILQFLVDLAGETKYTLNVLFGQCHSGPDSYHHKGKAVDFGCPLDTSIADEVGRKYGISHNDEACGGKNDHWHYSIGGN